jgi:5-methylcytosine-specific restriction endonuclease McrA
MKICSSCKDSKPTSLFYADKRKKDGLYSSCSDCQKKYKKYDDKRIVYEKQRSQNPEFKAKKAEYMRSYKKANRAKYNAWNMKYYVSKKFRTPAWLTDIDFERIQNEYKLAELLCKVTGSSWEVDHIVPLLGKNVSGLHVPSNLKVIPRKDNLTKSNRFEVI